MGGGGGLRCNIRSSLDEDIGLVEFLDILLDLAQLPLVVLLPSLESGGVDEPEVGHHLVLLVNLIPLAFESLADLADLLGRENLSE
jgi:hypothetical protein